MSEELRRPGRLRTFRLGSLTISYVPDGAVQLRPHRWLPGAPAEVWQAHPEYLDPEGNLVASIGGLLVEQGAEALLIDTGFGPHTQPAQPSGPIGTLQGGALLSNLALLGRTPADISTVAFTHLHPDHTGWAESFANAEYLLTEPEWTSHPLDRLTPRVRTVSDDEEIFPGVRVLQTGGHTPGHAAYVITSGAQRVIAFGDALHTPLQASDPSWAAVSDHDTTESTKWRHHLVSELSTPDTMGFGVHFADVQFGRVADGMWLPVMVEQAGK